MKFIYSTLNLLGFLLFVLLLVSTSCQNEKQLGAFENAIPLRQFADNTILKQSIPPENPQPSGVGISQHAMPSAIHLGNAKLRASLWGPTGRLTVSLGKNDVFDRRMIFPSILNIDEVKKGCFDPKNEMYDNIKSIRGQNGGSHLKAGGGWEFRYGAWQAYEFPCQKPVGQFVMLISDLKDAKQPQANIHCRNGLVSFEIDNGKAKGQFNFLTMQNSNIIAVKANLEGLENNVGIRLFRHKDTCVPGDALNTNLLKQYDYSRDSLWNVALDAPSCGNDGEYFWIRQDLPAEKTFPDGFYYYLVGKVVNKVQNFREDKGEKYLGTLARVTEISNRPSLSPDYDKIREAPGWAVTAELQKQKNIEVEAYITVVTNNDSKDPLETARINLDRASKKGFDKLLNENTDWYNKFYEQRENGRIIGADNSVYDTTYMASLFKSWIDTDLGTTKPDVEHYEVDETNNYLEVDKIPWHGLPCFNELYLTDHMVQNRPDRLEFWSKFSQHWLPAAKNNARDMWGLPGMFFSHGYFPPIKNDAIPHTQDTWEFGTESPAQILKMAWDVWDYGGDVEFLKSYVYEPLRELAIFYCSYVTRGEDGYYHAIPSMAVEHWGLTYQWKYNIDALIALTAIKWTLKNAIEAANFLNRDRDLISGWKKVLDNVAPYPTSEMKAGKVLAELAGVDMQKIMDRPDIATVPGNTIWTVSAPYLLGDDINLDSDTALINLQYRTCRNMIGPFLYETHLLGKHPKFRYEKGKSLIQDLVPIKDNNELFLLCEKQPERLLNSRSGRIHLFPCVPDFAEIGFRKFLARGGFEVSAMYSGRKTTFLQVKARRDNVCRIANPWYGRKIKVMQLPDKNTIAITNDTMRIPGIAFQAKAGVTYELKDY